METLKEMKLLMEKISVDTYKVDKKGNHSASIRARKNSQRLKELVPIFRAEVLKTIKQRRLEKGKK